MRPGRRGDPPRAVVRRVRRRPSSFAGGVVRYVATRLEDDFALDPAAVEAAITPRTKALFLGYPCNPTGAVLPDDVQDELARIAERHDLLVYSDEIYDRLAYGDYRHRAFSALPGMRERTILMGGFSKAYAMTGWRVGYLAAPAAILEGIVKVHQYGIMSAPTTAQDAALEALLHGEADVERMRRRVRPAPPARRRRPQRDRPADVRAARRVLRVPADRPSTGLSSEAFAERLLDRGARRGRPGSARSGRRARATSGRATRPRTRSSRRRSCGSGGSSSDRQPERRPDDADDGADERALERYEAVIGIEVHCQLQDRRKMFCGCSTDYDGAPPNTPRLPGLPRPAGRAADDQPARRRARPRDRPRDRGDDARRRPAGTARTTSTRTCPRATRSASTTCRWRRAAG